jgi:hypothetical protein
MSELASIEESSEPVPKWFVCSISRSEPRNWYLCKKVGHYGIPAGRKASRFSVGDRMVVWLGGQGFVAEAIVSGPPSVPKSTTDAPWPGGTVKYGFIVPFDLSVEVLTPIHIPFAGQRQERTQIGKAQLRNSFSQIPATTGEMVSSLLRDQATEEAQARL